MHDSGQLDDASMAQPKRGAAGQPEAQATEALKARNAGQLADQPTGTAEWDWSHGATRDFVAGTVQ